MPQSPPLMTKTAYAKHRGVATAAVHAYVKSGKIAEKDGKIDWKKADKTLDAVLTNKGGVRAGAGRPRKDADSNPTLKKDGTQKEKPGPKEGQTNEFKPGSMAYLRIEREKLSLDKQRVDFEAMTGVLVNRTRAENVFRRNIEAAVKILERFPDKMAPRMAVESDEFTIRKYIRGEIVELCKELANIADSFPESLTGEAQ